MAQLARYLSLRLRCEVTDKTMLAGTYDFELLFAAPDNSSPGDITITPPAADSSRPPLPEAVQDQLGLRLQLQKAASEALIIDSAVRSSGN